MTTHTNLSSKCALLSIARDEHVQRSFGGSRLATLRSNLRCPPAPHHSVRGAMRRLPATGRRAIEFRPVIDDCRAKTFRLGIALSLRRQLVDTGGAKAAVRWTSTATAATAVTAVRWHRAWCGQLSCWVRVDSYGSQEGKHTLWLHIVRRILSVAPLVSFLFPGLEMKSKGNY